MDLHAAKTVLETRLISARLQVSSSRKLARIELYYRHGNMPSILRKLEKCGWRLVVHHVGWTESIVGRVYEHDQTTTKTYREAKAVFVAFKGRIFPEINITS